MRRLSISLAWEQTKSCLAADGRLLATVAAALIALPVAVEEVISPGGFTADVAKSPLILIAFVALVLILMGQLSIVRLTVGPSVSVGEAIVHGARRLPFYFLSALVIALGFLLVGLGLAVVLFALGAPTAENQLATSPAFAAVASVFAVIYCFFWVRIIAISAAVAGTEALGPIAIIQRSWEITSGHFWRLLGFLLLFFIGAAIALKAIQLLTAILATFLLGPLNSLSPSALVVALIDGIANSAVIAVLTVMLARIYVQLSGRGSIDVSVPSSGS